MICPVAALSGFGVLSRRRVLKLSLSAGGLVVAGGTGGLWALRGRAPAVAGLQVLTLHEYRTLSALAGAAFPGGGVIPVGAASLDLARRLDEILAGEPPWNVGDMKRALLLLEFGPVLFDRRLVTFSNLPAPERLAHFERWGVSGSLVRRQVSTTFRKLLGLLFYDSPAVWPHIGYDGPAIPAGAGEEPR